MYVLQIGIFVAIGIRPVPEDRQANKMLGREESRQKLQVAVARPLSSKW